MRKLLFRIFISILPVLCLITSCDIEPYLICNVDTIEFSAKGGEPVNIFISTNKDWSASVDKEWCRLSAYSGIGADKSVKHTSVSCSENTGTTDRECFITITAEDLTQAIHIIQHPKDGFTVNKRTIAINHKAQEFYIDITSSIKYNYIVDVKSRSWLFPSSTKGVTHDILSFEATTNTSANERTGVIEFYDVEDGSLLDSVTIIQNGMPGNM